jgi:hypothetical protein
MLNGRRRLHDHTRGAANAPALEDRFCKYYESGQQSGKWVWTLFS